MITLKSYHEMKFHERTRKNWRILKHLSLGCTGEEYPYH